MRTKVSTRGRISLPVELRRLDHIRPGEELEIERLDAGEYRLTRVAQPANAGLVDWLFSCPEKGYFVPIEPR